ncbi:MAG: hypothetical protein KFB97_06475 [Cyanobium sp. M30B3]|nr:MAG: hypothetical protein KFB97_06475 [Cyanobium sp. M30B3]
MLALAATVPFDACCNHAASGEDRSRRLIAEFLDEVGSAGEAIKVPQLARIIQGSLADQIRQPVLAQGY